MILESLFFVPLLHFVAFLTGRLLSKRKALTSVSQQLLSSPVWIIRQFPHFHYYSITWTVTTVI